MSRINRLLKIICVIIPLNYAFITVAQELTTPSPDGNKLSGLLNKVHSVENNPSLSADGQTMILKSNMNGSWQLFESVLKEDNTWSEPQPINTINSYGDSTDRIGHVRISYDGKQIFFAATYREGIGGTDIYVSTKNGNKWGIPENIGHPINSTGNEDSPSLSPDGKTLYFTRLKNTENIDLDRNFNETCYEILASRKKADGSWSEPEPLPYPVNYKCDKMPLIMADNKTLIFSSHRTDDSERYELYQSRNIDGMEWSYPVPLNFINSTIDDHYMSVTAQGNGFFYSNQGEIRHLDIPEDFRPSPTAVITGYVKDQEKENSLDVKIITRDAKTYEELFTSNNNPGNGKYRVVLPVHGIYNLEFSRNNYSNSVRSIDLTSIDQYELIEKNMTLFSRVDIHLSVQDEEIFTPLPARITVSKKKDSTKITETRLKPEKGFAEIELPVGEVYILRTELKNFKSDTTTLDLSGTIRYQTIKKNIRLSPLKVGVPVHATDANTLEEVRGHVIINNQFREEKLEINANEMSALRAGDQYEIRTKTRKDYFYESALISVERNGITLLSGSGRSVSLAGNQLEFKLTPIEVNKTLILEGINFQHQSDRLTHTAYKKLERLIELLTVHPTMSIEIGVHTDNSGSNTYNTDLSRRRAHCIKDYLIINEIEMNRLTAKGYGATKPVLPNNSEENRAYNRRVEIRILEILN